KPRISPRRVKVDATTRLKSSLSCSSMSDPRLRREAPSRAEVHRTTTEIAKTMSGWCNRSSMPPPEGNQAAWIVMLEVPVWAARLREVTEVANRKTSKLFRMTGTQVRREGKKRVGSSQHSLL